jgi:hypothetical protein
MGVGKKITVTAYAGYRGEETPRRFVLDSQVFEVVEVVERALEEGARDSVRRRLFRVRTDDGRLYRLCHDETSDAWFLLS